MNEACRDCASSALAPSFALEVRAAAQSAVPEGMFLRRDRREALYVAGFTRPEGAAPDGWQAALAAAGFLLAPRGNLTALTPGPAWLDRLEGRYPQPPDGLCASLRRFAGAPADDAALSLFAAGLKCLETAEDGRLYEKRLRQRAAVCLREGYSGGGLYACALLAHLLRADPHD